MKKFTFLFSAGFAICSFAFAQDNNTINPDKGQRYLVENKLNTVSSSEMMGQTMESKANFTTTFNIEVKEVKDNNINFTNTITSLKMNVNAMGQDLSFDSDKKEDMDGDIGKNFKDVINQPKDVVMDNFGNVIITEKIDTLAENKSSGNPTEMIMKQMGGDPAEQGYGAKMAFHAIPKNAKKGSTWTDSSSSKGTT
ncbi:MAG: DUF6263 family protein, partial [Ginsengibacter sp.]